MVGHRARRDSANAVDMFMKIINIIVSRVTILHELPVGPGYAF